MSRYYIVVGDKTSCCGVLTGASCFKISGFNVARITDDATCGKDGKSYKILEGVTNFKDGSTGFGFAISDCKVGCPCGSSLIASTTYCKHTDGSLLIVWR